MLTQAQMGGMDEMGIFYETCLESLYPPGKCGAFCNEHTYECLLAEVQQSCCDEGGRNCPESSAVPLTCPVGCALVFPQFMESCHTHISESGLEVADFEAFEARCLEVDGLALVEYSINLQRRGCTINLHSPTPKPGGSQGGHRRMQAILRRLQDIFMSTWLGVSSPGCRWDDLDDLVSEVNLVCCGEGQCADGGQPPDCSPGCAVATHQFMNTCGAVVEQVVGADAERFTALQEFDASCIDAADPVRQPTTLSYCLPWSRLD